LSLRNISLIYLYVNDNEGVYQGAFWGRRYHTKLAGHFHFSNHDGFICFRISFETHASTASLHMISSHVDLEICSDQAPVAMRKQVDILVESGT